MPAGRRFFYGGEEFVVVHLTRHFEIVFQNKEIRIGCEHYQGKKGKRGGVEVFLSQAFYSGGLGGVEDPAVLNALQAVIIEYFRIYHMGKIEFS